MADETSRTRRERALRFISLQGAFALFAVEAKTPGQRDLLLSTMKAFNALSQDIIDCDDERIAALREVERLTDAIKSHNRTKRSPGCGHSLNHADENLWAEVGIDSWGDPLPPRKPTFSFLGD